MVCKIVSRLSKNRYRVEADPDGKKYTVLSSISDSLVIGDYVIVTDLCILARTSKSAFQGTFRV